MNLRKTTMILAMALCCLSVMGCMRSLEDMPLDSAGYGMSRLKATVSYQGVTKGALLTSVPDTITLFACNYEEANMPDGVKYIYNEPMVKSGSQWETVNEFSWVPSTQTVLYFAISPADAPGLTIPDADAFGEPAFHYVMPANVSNQKDLIVASYEHEGGSCEEIDLSFSHILSAISFKFTDEGAFEGTLKSISITNIKRAGDYVTSGVASGWSNLSTAGSATKEVNMTVTEDMGGEEIVGVDDLFLIIPQTCGTGAELRAVVNDGSEDKELYCDLSGMKFTAGKRYELSLDMSKAGEENGIEGMTSSYSTTEWEW